MGAVEARVVHLDANFLVEIAAGRRAQVRQTEQWLRDEIAIQVSAVAWSEFLCGPLLDFELRSALAVVSKIDPFTDEHAALAADLFNLTGRRSRSHVDCMIAAHAIRLEAPLATLNDQDFRSFKNFGLQLA